MPGPSAAAVLLAAWLAAAPGPGGTLVLRLQDPALLESSGLTASQRHDGILWTHADGGSAAEVRAVDESGDTVAVVTLAGIDPYDPEALAPGRGPDGTPQLWLGDIGDNEARRPDVSVFRFEEPRRLRDRTVPAEWFRLTYPDGPHDAEALLVQPRTGRVHIATKDLAGCALYRAPADLVPEGTGVNELERVADLPALVTDGAFLPDGRMVLRTYTSVHLYGRDGEPLAVAALPPQPQGESLAVDGDRLLVGSEGRRSAVYAVPVPRSPSGDLPTQASDPDGAAEDFPPRTVVRAVLVAATVLVLAGVAVARRRRRR